MTFTEHDLLAAIRAAVNTGPDDARTCTEWADAMDVSAITMRKRILILLQSGHMEHVRVKRTRINGVLSWIDAYRVKQ